MDNALIFCFKIRVPDMPLTEAEAVVAKVEPLESRAIEESLGMKLVNVTFRVLQRERQAKDGRAAILQPEWLAKLLTTEI
jgi:hypothetical protein